MWWNTYYKFRRKVRISTNYGSLAAGTILIYPFNTLEIYNLGKVRSDYEDIEVVHHLPGIDQYQVLPRSVDDNNVNFQIDQTLRLNMVSEGEYYVYYGNPNLNNALQDVGANTTSLVTTTTTTKIPTPIIYTGNTLLRTPLKVNAIRTRANLYAPYVIKQAQRTDLYLDFWSTHIFPESERIAYTKPGEWWVSGMGLIPEAVATVTFSSDRIRIISSIANTQGIALIRVDQEDWEKVDLFNQTSQGEVTIYSKEGLEPKTHTIQMKVSGEKSPDSFGYSINFQRFETLDVAKMENLGEEVNPDLVWTSVFGGAI